jgi:hypothetical protein
MKITSEWLQKQHACLAEVEWFKNQTETKPEVLIAKLIDEERLDWANWLIVRVLTHKQQIAYAIYAAEQAVEIFEKHNPEDKRPRIIIDAARAVLKRNTRKNRLAAYYAADSAKAAAYANTVYVNAAAKAAADRAFYAYAAAYNAAAAAACTYAASAYAYAATAAEGAAASKKMKNRILAFGVKLLKSGRCHARQNR